MFSLAHTFDVCQVKKEICNRLQKTIDKCVREE
jgi:hypothetical protein